MVSLGVRRATLHTRTEAHIYVLLETWRRRGAQREKVVGSALMQLSLQKQFYTDNSVHLIVQLDTFYSMLNKENTANVT